MTKEKNAVLPQGFIYDPSAPLVKCIETPVECTDAEGAVWTWLEGTTGHQPYKKVNTTMCGLLLNRIN